MGFWSDAGELNTKRSYRWVCIVNNLHEWMIKSVTKPSFSISETSHRFINHTFWYPGRVEWSTCNIVMVDPVTPDAGKTVLHMIEQSGYQIPDGFAGRKWVTISKQKASEALNRVAIKQIDPDGNPLEVWTLHNPWIKDVKFGDLSYDGDDILNISLTIRFDWANMWAKNKAHAGASTIGADASFPSSYTETF